MSLLDNQKKVYMESMNFKSLAESIGPLRYQSSKADCVPTTIINALLLLLGKPLPPPLVRLIWASSLDLSDYTTGSVGCNILASVLDSWFKYALDDEYEAGNLDFKSKIISGKGVHLKQKNSLSTCLRQGVACITTENGKHYCLVHSQLKNGSFLGFDPDWNNHQNKNKRQENFDSYHGLVNISWKRDCMINLLGNNSNKWIHLIYPEKRKKMSSRPVAK